MARQLDSESQGHGFASESPDERSKCETSRGIDSYSVHTHLCIFFLWFQHFDS